MRKPSVKKSIKARTTGRAKRAVKKAVVPGYGKKGMGWVKNPKKAMYNKVYHKTTFGVNDLVKVSSGGKRRTSTKRSSKSGVKTNQNVSKGQYVDAIPTAKFEVKVKVKPAKSSGIIMLVIALVAMLISRVLGILGLLLAAFLFYDYVDRTKRQDYISDSEMMEWAKKLQSNGQYDMRKNTFAVASKMTQKILQDMYPFLKTMYDKMDKQIQLSQKEKLDLIKIFKVVIDFEDYIVYKNKDTRFHPEWMKGQKKILVQSYIDEEYNKAVNHALTLKTDSGRLNQIVRYRSAVLENLSPITEDFEDYMNQKVCEQNFLNRQDNKSEAK